MHWKQNLTHTLRHYFETLHKHIHCIHGKQTLEIRHWNTTKDTLKRALKKNMETYIEHAYIETNTQHTLQNTH